MASKRVDLSGEDLADLVSGETLELADVTLVPHLPLAERKWTVFAWDTDAAKKHVEVVRAPTKDRAEGMMPSQCKVTGVVPGAAE